MVDFREAKYPWGNEPPEGRALFDQSWDLFQPVAPTQPVGQYAPNGYGLHDMAGSVWEWTQTLYYNYETQEASEDARVRAVVRGGSWGSQAEELFEWPFVEIMRLVCGQTSLEVWAFAVFEILLANDLDVICMWFSLIQKNSSTV